MPSPDWRKTACNLCYVNCGLEVLVDDDRITKVRGDRDNPKSKGYLCNKAARIPFYAHHRDRLTTPLRRRADGGFDAIDWDTAIAEIAARLREVVDRHGGKSLALYGGGGQGNHAGGAYGDRAAARARLASTSSMRCRRRRPAISGSTATCSAARPATPPKTCIIATCCS